MKKAHDWRAEDGATHSAPTWIDGERCWLALISVVYQWRTLFLCRVTRNEEWGNVIPLLAVNEEDVLKWQNELGNLGG